jgi:hypothetical protein
LPHPEQLGFSFLFKKVHVPQYVPQGATNFSLKHPASAAKDFSSTIILFWLDRVSIQTKLTKRRCGKDIAESQ